MKSTEELLKEIYSHFDTEDPEQTMSDLVVDSIEGGIDYWNTRHPKTIGESEFYSERVWETVKAGGTLVFGDNEEEGKFNLESILKSLNTLMKHDPRVYAAIKDESRDAEDCDVFFQTAIFGEVVFG